MKKTKPKRKAAPSPNQMPLEIVRLASSRSTRRFYQTIRSAAIAANSSAR